MPDPAQAHVPGELSAEMLEQLAAYGGFPLPPERVRALLPALSAALAVLRQLRPADYDTLPPATVFHAPPPERFP